MTHRSNLPPEQQGIGQRPIVGICGPARCEDGKFSGNENVLGLNTGDAQLCEYTKNY